MSASLVTDLGQLLIIRWGEDAWSAALEQRLRSCRPAGVLLTAADLRTPESTAELLAKVARALQGPPFLVLEQEGGRFDPLRALLPALPSPQAAARKGAAAVKKLGELTGAGRRLLGFNADLAPVLDLSNPVWQSSLATRAFSTDPQEVARCGAAFVRGLRRHKILACGKHFPGLGSVRKDVHSKLPLSSKPMANLWREDLVPFRELLPHLPLVMLSPAAYKAYDFDLARPAMFSANVVEGLLRVKLGYQGVAVADLRELEGVLGKVDAAAAVVKSLQAGCDLMIVGSRKESPEGALEGLKHKMESGRISAQRVAQALERIRVAKRGLAPPPGKIPKHAFMQLSKQSEQFSKEFASQEQANA
jgi:beta-N-acetylhexosaminidase